MYYNNKMYSCPYCLSTNSPVEDQHSGDTICTDCGSVHDNVICFGDSFNDHERCSGSLPTTRTTSLVTSNPSHLATHTPANVTSTFNTEYDTLLRHCENLNLPEHILLTAFEYFCNICVSRTTRGNVRKCLLAACIWSACHHHDVAVILKDLIFSFDITSKHFTKSYKIIQHHSVSLTQSSACSNYSDVFITTSNKLANKLYNKGLFSDKKKFMQFKNRINKLFLKHLSTDIQTHKTESIFAGFALFVAQELRIDTITRDLVTDTCQISIVTLNKVLRKIRDHLRN